MLSEDEGRAVLRAVFERRGYAILEDYRFTEGDLSFVADGWDPQARVGYEYLTRIAGDHEAMSSDLLSRLSRWVESGRLYLFLIDEEDIEVAEELSEAAEAFLDEVARRRAAESR